MTVQINGTSGITTPGIITDTSVANTSSTLTGESVNRIKTYTAQATTSGTSIVFNNIPSWAKRITILLDQVSTNGSDQVTSNLGTSSGFEPTGYLGSSGYVNGGNQANAFNIGNGTSLTLTSAASVRNGKIVYENVSGNTWIFTGNVGDSNSANLLFVYGRKAMAGVVTQLRITTINGADTFDGGSVNIIVEG